MSHYTIKELTEMGIKCFGKNIKISKKCSIYNPTRLILHDNIRIDDFSILSGKGEIEIKNYVHISCHCFLTSSTKIFFDDFAAISSGVKLFGSSDDYSGNFLISPLVPVQYSNVQTGDIILHKYSVVASSSVVLPGVELKEGSVLASLSLTKTSLEPWSIYGGSPAKFLKKRSDKCSKLFFTDK